MAYCGKMEKKIKKLTDEIKDNLEKAFSRKTMKMLSLLK
jgi:hypothetical protein